MTCSHERVNDVWVEPSRDLQQGDWGYEEGHWERYVESTTEDIDVGRFRCTQCGEVMYYTGRWRDIYEGKQS